MAENSSTGTLDTPPASVEAVEPAIVPNIATIASDKNLAADSERSHARGSSVATKPLRIAIVVMLAILSVQWIILVTTRPNPLEIRRGEEFRESFRVDVNEATWVEWSQLEGIGLAMAHRIVTDRKLNGPFSSIEDITRVPGIGAVTLDRIRPWLTIRHEPDQPVEARSAVRDHSTQKSFATQQQPPAI
jgi:competence ComEA-like helix-hairpin-helix protein